MLKDKLIMRGIWDKKTREVQFYIFIMNEV